MATKAKKRVEPQTWEEFVAREADQFQLHHFDEHPPEVNYLYKPGQPVRLGNRPDCRVEEVLEGGKKLLISYHDRGENYGKPYDNQRRLPMFVWWNNIDPVEGVLDTKFARPRIDTQYTQTGLDGLVHTSYHRGLIDSPEYQRDYVWSLVDKQRLVKSLFDHADIGKFLLLEHPHPEYRLEIIDGKQRLGAVREFMEGRFLYEGVNWFQLSWGDKQAFTDNMVQIATLQSDKVKKSDILWLFLSINRGGVPQTEEHIAKAKALYEQALQEEGKPCVSKE
jgi:hypothetical protein